MESLSNNTNEKGEAITFQADLEALSHIDSEIYESIQKELQEAEKLWEKARGSLLKLDDKDVCWLKAMMSPPKDVSGVIFACVHLMAGNVTEKCFRDDSKKGIPKDFCWGECRELLNGWKIFRNQMLRAKTLIDEGKISEENFGSLKELLNREGFNIDSVKGYSESAWLFCDAMINPLSTKKEFF